MMSLITSGEKPKARVSFEFDEIINVADRYKAVGQACNQSGEIFRLSDDRGLAMVQRHRKMIKLERPSVLMAAIADRMDINFYKNGKHSSTGPRALDVSTMMHSESFLRELQEIDSVYDMPHYDADFNPMRLGLNYGHKGFNCYVNAENPTVIESMNRMTDFLDAMSFEGPADRANLVAGLLTVQLRNHWPGGKPIILVTATRSHSGKDTCLDFVAADCRKNSISYSATDWSLELNFVGVLTKSPTDLLVIENAKAGSHNHQIGSMFLERFTTDPCPVLRTTQTKDSNAVPTRNEVVIGISTNDGLVSEDILNRAMVVHLAPKGDVAGQNSPIGNPRHDYLPQYSGEIAAEARGMIKRWVDAGKPQDDVVEHPCGPWARTIGGILKVNNIYGFLDNRSQHRISYNPVRDALSQLGTAVQRDTWLTLPYLQRKVSDLGLVGILIPKLAQESKASKEVALGKILTKHLDVKLMAETDTHQYAFALQKTRKRPENDVSANAVSHYQFRVLEEKWITSDSEPATE